MEKDERPNFTRDFLMSPQPLLRLLARTVKVLLVAVGVLVVLGGVLYLELESIVEALDSHFSDRIDAYLSIDKDAVARLHDPAYFAAQSAIVSEDERTVACISSAEHRILINDPADIPPFFTSAILASEDKNFFEHEGIDKGAVVRALAKRLLQESRSGASTLEMQIAKHLRGGTGRQSTEIEKTGDMVMALRTRA